MRISNQKTMNEQVNRINLLSNYQLGHIINESDDTTETPDDTEAKDKSEKIYNQIVSSIEGLGTDEDSLKDAVKQIKTCSDLQKINDLISKDPIDGEKYKNLYAYINSDMNWGDEELVEELEEIFNEICEDSVEVVDGVLVEKEPIDSGVLVDNVVEPTKLIRDLKREGLDDSLSKALAANAYGESGFKVNNYGDGGSYSKSAKNIDRSVEIKGDKFCSFGLWQFNICGGLGVGLLDFYGVDVDNSTDKEKLDVLTDYNKQVKFMVDHIKKSIPSEGKSVSEWINWIVDNVERPSDKSSAKSKRNKYAEEKGWI